MHAYLLQFANSIFFIAGEDYSITPNMLIISPMMNRACFNITILDDDKYEFNEDFFINLTSSDPQTGLLPITALVTIVDVDGKFNLC